MDIYPNIQTKLLISEIKETIPEEQFPYITIGDIKGKLAYYNPVRGNDIYFLLLLSAIQSIDWTFIKEFLWKSETKPESSEIKSTPSHQLMITFDPTTL